MIDKQCKELTGLDIECLDIIDVQCQDNYKFNLIGFIGDIDLSNDNNDCYIDLDKIMII